MPWNDQVGGPGDKGPGDKGSGARGPWGGGAPPRGQPPKSPQGPGGPDSGPDLEDMMRRWRAEFAGLFGGRGPDRNGGERRPRGINPGAIVAVAAIGWLLTGVYVVDEGERAVISRFGAALDGVQGPGMHWHMPLPIETANIISVSGQRTLDIGVGEGANATSESLMITGDRNIVDIDFRVIYRLSDPRKYLFNVADQRDAIRGLAESAMREVVGQRRLQAIITTDRAAVETAVQAQLQQGLDSYDAGVDVMQVQLLNAGAPTQVADAFYDVIRAGADAEGSINQANQYKNSVIPRAGGEAAQITASAQAYAEQAVREANGDAARFISVEQQYRAAPQVTRERLYLETMERIYRGANMIIVERGSGAVPILPLDQMRRPAPAPAPAAPAAPQQQQQPGTR